MAASLKAFDNVVKRFTLCGQCDSKVSENPFFQCGCKKVLCLYCHEKHNCGCKLQALKYNCLKDCKSISFIHDLANEALKHQHIKEKEKKISKKLENTSPTNSSLPDLDDIIVHKNQEEVSFSELFDDVKCYRNERPKGTYSGIKRQSISPRISYTQKRKQYLSDTEDEDVFEKTEISQKTFSNFSPGINKRSRKKRKPSTKMEDISIVYTDGCDLNSSQQDNKKRNLRGRRSSEVASVSLTKLNADSGSLLPEVPSPIPCLIVEEINLLNKPSEEKTYDNNYYETERKMNSSKESVIEEYTNHLYNDNLQAVIFHDNTVVNAERALENEISSIPTEKEFSNHPSSDDIDNNSDIVNKTVKFYKPKFYNRNLKKRDKDNHNKESVCKNKSNKTGNRKLDNNDKTVINNYHRDFDGFDQCDINASTLNYMFYKLTTPFDENDEMVFPMNYKGKNILIHVGRNNEAKIINGEYHYLLTQYVDIRSKLTQTDDKRGENQVSKTVQTEDPLNNDASIGLDGFKNQEVQTDPYFVTEKSVGPEARSIGIVQTDGYSVSDACVGLDAGVSVFIQTVSYHTVDACIGPDGKVSKFSQTDSYQVQDSCSSPKTFMTTGVQTDLDHITPSSAGPDMSMLAVGYENFKFLPSLKLELAQDDPESAQENGFPFNSPAIGKGSSDNEDDDIIEGTPVKSNNLSFSSLNLSSLKERTLRFDFNTGSPLTRDEIVSCSDLGDEEKEMVQKFTKSFGMDYSEYFDNKTTHLVVSSRLSHQSHKTFKYLLAVASKAFVVSFMWVTKSLQAGKVLPVDEFIPTNNPGPLRCRLNVKPPFSGLTICSQLFTGYPGLRPTEALCRLCGAFIVEDLGQSCLSENWPFPRFCLYEKENDLSSQVLNSCSKNHIVAIHYSWVFDSVAAYQRLPIIKHLSSTFMLTDDIIEAYKIPGDMIIDVEFNKD